MGCGFQQNKEKLKLNFIESKSFNFEYQLPIINDYLIKLMVDSAGVPFVLYVQKNDSILVKRNLVTDSIEPIFKYNLMPTPLLSSFQWKHDTLVSFYDNQILNIRSKDYSKDIVLHLDSSRFYKDYGCFPIDYTHNSVFIQYGLSNNTTFIDSFSDMVFILNSDYSINSVKEIAPFPDYYKIHGVQYYRNSIRTISSDFVYYNFEKSDDVIWYAFDNWDSWKGKTQLFTDLKRSEEELYDESKGRDFVYLKKYEETTELNIPTYQEQSQDVAYFIKRLAKKKQTDANKYVLGKVKNQTYIGYVYLPEDFNDVIHYFVNNHLYYISTQEVVWKHYEIQEL